MAKTRVKPKSKEPADHEAEERDRWKRFKRDTKADLAVLTALLNASASQDRESRALRIYDHLILQLMAVYVSPAALERYRAGFTEEALEEINDRDDMAWGVVNAESGMMTALKEMVAEHPLHRQRAFDDFVDQLYFRWQYVEMTEEVGIEALSADGANVALE